MSDSAVNDCDLGINDAVETFQQILTNDEFGRFVKPQDTPVQCIKVFVMCRFMVSLKKKYLRVQCKPIHCRTSYD